MGGQSDVDALVVFLIPLGVVMSVMGKIYFAFSIFAVIALAVIELTHPMPWEGYAWCGVMQAMYIGLMIFAIDTIRIEKRDQALYEESLRNNG